MTQTILVAEDDGDVQQLLAYKLRANGFEVVTTDDGQECVDYLEETDELPSVVILDVMMPRMSGLQVLNWIRSDDSLSDLPVLLLTSRSREADVVQGLEYGASDYVTKPFSTGELITRLERISNQS